MITLYNVPVSSYGSKVIILLRHKGLAWTELPPPGGYGSPAYKAIIPAGTVPAIQHDGISLADSEAIAEYLNELHANPPMPPLPWWHGHKRAKSPGSMIRLEPVLRSFFGQVAPDQRNPESSWLRRPCSGQARSAGHYCAPAPFMSGDTLACRLRVSASFAILELLQTVIGLDITLPAPLATYSSALNAHPSVYDEAARYRGALADWASKGAGSERTV